jgi:dihydrofolate reductase
MPTFHAIAAMSENRVIGNQGKIPWHLPEDFRWFKHKTMGGTLVMGRKTFMSIGKPLPGRNTVILSKRTSLPGVDTCMDLPALSRVLERSPRPYWVCGGAEIYSLLLEKCELLYLTTVKQTVAGDVFFPPFEASFILDSTIHENEKLRIERWKNKALLPESQIPQEQWPFS